MLHPYTKEKLIYRIEIRKKVDLSQETLVAIGNFPLIKDSMQQKIEPF